jgi:hypothetical protein
VDRRQALKLLRGGTKGIAEWNRRRIAGEAIPDLDGVKLRKAEMIDADLRSVKLP